MSEIRSAFHQELDALERTLLGVFDRAEQMVQTAVDAFTTGRLDLAHEVIAADDEIDQTYLDVDSLAYLTLDGMLGAVPDGPDGFCHACFSGDYPTVEPELVQIGKPATLSGALV